MESPATFAPAVQVGLEMIMNSSPPESTAASKLVVKCQLQAVPSPSTLYDVPLFFSLNEVPLSGGQACTRQEGEPGDPEPHPF